MGLAGLGAGGSGGEIAFEGAPAASRPLAGCTPSDFLLRE
jgi:hypothetical protein